MGMPTSMTHSAACANTALLWQYKFTGKERDAESGLDYFGARYFGSALGRFTSPDPLMASAHASDPQSDGGAAACAGDCAGL